MFASWEPDRGLAAAARGTSPRRLKRGKRRLSQLAAVEHAQHQDGAAIVAVLKEVRSAEHPEDDFAVLVAMPDRSSQLWMPTEHVRSGCDLTGDACGELWELRMQERGEPVEIGERVERPLDLYWPGHCRNPGVPHVRSH